MKRNRERYEYQEISLLKSGTLHRLLMADVGASGQSLAQTILARLALSYGLLAPGPSVSPALGHGTAPSVLQAKEESEKQTRQEEESVFDMDAALKNAALFDI